MKMNRIGMNEFIRRALYNLSRQIKSGEYMYQDTSTVSEIGNFVTYSIVTMEDGTQFRIDISQMADVKK